jgi:hypothetical protein
MYPEGPPCDVSDDRLHGYIFRAATRMLRQPKMPEFENVAGLESIPPTPPPC